MLTKAIIVKNIDEYSSKIRIPIYHKAKESAGAIPDSALPIAYYSMPPGTKPEFKEGEVVWVSFELDDASDPVIIGSLVSENNTSASNIKAISLDVEVNSNLENSSNDNNTGPAIDLSKYMVKGVDYVTAGQKSETTLGDNATAEGEQTTASGEFSHAEGVETIASGDSSHAEGYYTTASGDWSHAEGDTTIASGNSSHAEGYYTTAQSQSQHVFGEYNILDATGSTTTRGTYVEIVGNGTSSTHSNARTLDWSGNEVLAGALSLATNKVVMQYNSTTHSLDITVS